jgi:hypothetical protein
MYVTCHQGVSVRYFYAVTGGVVRYFRTITRGSVLYFRTVTSVAHFRVIASEVVFGVNFLAISLETLHCAQQLTNLFMFLYQKWFAAKKCSHQVTLSAVHWQVAATVTNHLVRCSRSVIIPPYVVFRASLLRRRTYLNARYSSCRSNETAGATRLLT